MIPTGTAIRKRILAFLTALCILFCVLATQLFRLQVMQAEELQARAQSQWTSKSVVSARRGSILDRNGVALAVSATAYAVSVNPRQVDDPAIFAQTLAPILGMDEAAIYKKASDRTKGGLTIKRQLSADVAGGLRGIAAKLKAEGNKALDGMYFEQDNRRYYPMGAFLTQVLGLTTIDGVGQSGLEARLDDYLAGKNGAIVNETDGKGLEMPYSVSEYVPPVNGGNVTLTIDANIQGFTEKALRQCIAATGAVAVQAIVMDVNTGEILAMASKPDYDPNDPPRDDVELLTSLMRIRQITDVYEPGSTFKIITSSAALSEKVTNPSEGFYCSGSCIVEGGRIRCWASAHGAESMARALQNSCNPVFVELGLRLGIPVFYGYLRAFGFGKATGVDLSGESGGILIPEGSCKTVDIARIGFGQSVAVTPMQLITAVSAVANGGSLMKPYIVGHITDANGETLLENAPTTVSTPISADISKLMRELLTAVVEDGGGRNAHIEGYNVAGKTGTAQIYVDGRISTDAHIGSFVGFAPSDNPAFAVLVVVHEAALRPDYGSITAAPYAKLIIEDTLRYFGCPANSAGAALAEEVEVPAVTGSALAEAANALKQVGLRYQASGNGASVTDQLPAAGAKVLRDSLVMLYTDAQSETGGEGPSVEVPDVSGRSIVEAGRLLETFGLKLEISGSGVAAEQSPLPGERIQMGETVRVAFALP